ncbi:MAG: hypothetical protein HY211_07485 [Candidatus Omnitrophica bacterium]|nr:hypothetical protein [Candidatus Omnitrophota bacterium]
MPKPHEPVHVGVISREQPFFTRFETFSGASEREGGILCRIHRLDFPEKSAEQAADVVVIDLDSMGDDFLKHLPGIRQQNARSWITVTYQHPSPERLLKSVRAGANDYLPYPPTMGEFHEMLLRARDLTGGNGVRPRGHLISIFGNTGGVGTTTLAIQVAASLRSKLGPSSQVVLVDLVLQRGDLSAFLDVPTTYSLVNLVTELDRVDPSYLHSVLPKHPSGIYVLPAPYAPDEADLVTSVQIGRMLHILHSVFDGVVVDAGHEFSEVVLSALEASDRVLLLTLPLLPSIRNTRRTLDLFDRLSYDPAKLILVLNRGDASGRVDLSTIEETLGRPMQWSIPNDYETTVKAINQATTVQAIKPLGKLADNIEQMVAKHILGQTSSTPFSPRPSKNGNLMKTLLNIIGRPLHGPP